MKKILFFIIILLSACGKDNQESAALIAPETFLQYIKSQVTEQPDATISVFCDPVTKDFPKPKILMTAFLDNQLDNGSAIKDVSLANFKLPKVVDSINNRTFFTATTDAINPFNQDVAVNFNTTFFDLKSNVRLPALVKLDIGKEKFSKSKGYTLNWNKDENNNLPIQIHLMYSEDLTRHINPTANVVKETIQLTKFASDEGKFTLTSADLAAFPLGSVVIASIRRGSFSYQKSNGKNILIYAITTDTYPALFVED